MKYKASNTTIWKNDSGKLIQLIANVTVIESSRKLDDGKYPYFYKVDEESVNKPNKAGHLKVRTQTKEDPKRVARPRPVVKLPQKK